MECSLRRFFTPSGVRSASDRMRLIWRQTLDPRPLFIQNRAAGRVITVYFGANRWGRTHSLLITSKESQLAIQFFHYRLPLISVQLRAVGRKNIVVKSNKFPFPMILVWDRKWVNVARYSVEDHLISWWVGRPRLIGLILSQDKRSDVRENTWGRSDKTSLLHF